MLQSLGFTIYHHSQDKLLEIPFHRDSSSSVTNISLQELRVNILGFMGHTFTIITTQVDFYSSKAAVTTYKQMGMAMFQ